MSSPNLMAGPPATFLPPDPAARALADAGPEELIGLVAGSPATSLGWARLAELALGSQTPDGDVAGYAFARTGYHRGLDALRRAGWKGHGPVPWEHEPNRGFLRALWALGVAAGRIGEDEERDRCAGFLRESSATAYDVLAGRAAAPG